MRSRPIFTTLAATALLAAAGCASYRFTSQVPEELRSIAVPVFENESGFPEIDAVVTQYVLREFQRHRVRLNMDLEMPTVETIKLLVARNKGVGFLPKMCVEHEIAQGLLCGVRVKELNVTREIRLVYPARRALSHAARAFLEVVRRQDQ